MKGATLLESLIAMVILAVCFSISVMIFVTVLNSSENKKLLFATLQINEISLHAQQSKNYLDEEIRTDEYRFLKRISVRENARGLIEMKISAFDRNNHLIAERKELIIASHEK